MHYTDITMLTLVETMVMVMMVLGTMKVCHYPDTMVLSCGRDTVMTSAHCVTEEYFGQLYRNHAEVHYSIFQTFGLLQ